MVLSKRGPSSKGSSKRGGLISGVIDECNVQLAHLSAFSSERAISAATTASRAAATAVRACVHSSQGGRAAACNCVFISRVCVCTLPRAYAALVHSPRAIKTHRGSIVAHCASSSARQGLIALIARASSLSSPRPHRSHRQGLIATALPRRLSREGLYRQGSPAKSLPPRIRVLPPSFSRQDHL